MVIKKNGSKRVRVGRGPDCDLVLPDPSVSRLHAEFILDDTSASI